MPGHGFVHTSSPTSPRTELALLVEHVDGHAERGPAERTRRQRLHDVRREEARADFGAARDVDHRAAAPADDVEVPPPRRFVPRFAGRREDAQRRRSCARTGSSPCAISARISVGDTPSTLTRCRSTRCPQAIGSREVGRAVVQHERAAVRERADDLPRAHDPADVGEPEQPFAGAQVGLERDLLARSSPWKPPCTCTAPFGPPGRAARVRDEQRMFAVDRTRRVERAALAGARRISAIADRRTHGVHASGPAPPPRRRSPSCRSPCPAA